MVTKRFCGSPAARVSGKAWARTCPWVLQPMEESGEVCIENLRVVGGMLKETGWAWTQQARSSLHQGRRGNAEQILPIG